MLKKILLFLLFALIVIQFIHPKPNRQEGPFPNAIATVFKVPAGVQSILEKACNDCHSNNTRYPWYARLQPVDWWMDTHVRDGKSELNLDEYAHRSLRFKYHKMEEIAEQVKEGKMPLNSYTRIHKDAVLTEAEKSALIAWADGIREEMRTQYPIDSLERRK